MIAPSYDGSMDQRDTVETPPLMAAGELTLRKVTARLRRAMKPLRVRVAIAALTRPRSARTWWTVAVVVAAALAIGVGVTLLA